MQISKILFVLCAAALIGNASPVAARETEAQAKAREALRKKMSELDAEKGPAAPVAPTPPQTPAAVSSPAAATAPRVANDDSTARAREAMRQKLRELDEQKKPAVRAQASASPRQSPAPTPVVQPPPPPARATPPPAPANVSPAQPAYAPTQVIPPDDGATARARAALRQKMAELDAQSGTSAKFTAKSPASSESGIQPGAEPAPTAAPPTPLAGSKDARLAELLRRYKADEITPNEYHKQRAKILAEP